MNTVVYGYIDILCLHVQLHMTGDEYTLRYEAGDLKALLSLSALWLLCTLLTLVCGLLLHTCTHTHTHTHTHIHRVLVTAHDRKANSLQC